MSDVVVDATPEEGQACAALPRHQTSTQGQPESLENLMNLKLKVSDEDHLTADFDEDAFTPYNHWFPEELKKKPNIAIINADEDQGEAHDMKVFIEKDVHLEIDGERFRPRVELLEKITPSLKVDALDYALAEADYLFIYITPNFTDSLWNKFQATASLKAIISEHKNTQCMLVCVHTDQSERDNLPATLRNAKHLNYCEKKLEQFTQDVRQLFCHISHRLLTKRHELTVLRKKHIDKNPHILQKTKQETSIIDGSEIPGNLKGNLTDTGKFSHDQACQPCMSSKSRSTGTAKQTPRANVEERDTGACGNDASRKPTNPQPHYRR